MSQLKNGLRMLLALTAVLTIIVCAVPVAGYTETGADPTPTLEIVSSYPYTTTTKVKVNLRANRSVRSTLLRKIPKGAEITVNSVSGSWAKVDYKEYSGYVMKEFIVLKEVRKIKVTPTPTPVPTLSPEEDAGGYQILQRGDSGDDVTALQEALIELGFLKGKADGQFGAATENAVKAFQEKNNYPVTGIMDANIQAFLYSDKPKNASGEKTSVKTLSPVDGVTMKRGAKGSKVTKLQNKLIELGYLKGEATGTYDTATIGAVRSFQKKNGLKADGAAGSETQTLLYSGSAISANATATPKVTASPTPTPTVAVPEESLKEGATGQDVKTIQKKLKELGYYKSSIDGKFGRLLTKAVKDFQEAHGLEADGVAGKSTYAVLFSDNALKVGTTATPLPTATPTAEPTAQIWETLRKNDSGDSVAQLQEMLISLGYLSGKADGNYGAQTVEAVRNFQKANGLTVDGSAGEETQKVLYGGNAKKASAAATATPKAGATATPAPTTSGGTLKIGSKGSEVTALQKKLISLGYLSGKADGIYGTKTAAAVKAYQKAKKLTADGIAGEKTLSSLGTTATAEATKAPTVATTQAVTSTPTAARVQYANWYDKIKSVARSYPYATVYDFTTGISYQIHIFSVGAHADYEPVTANDTAKMLKIFGGNTWNPKAVWVVFSNGSVYIGSTHSMPHDVQHIKDNNFAGHSCLHFPRTQEQVQAIGSYATKHQEIIDAGWATTQKMK